jgi:hypothetical protein
MLNIALFCAFKSATKLTQGCLYQPEITILSSREAEKQGMTSLRISISYLMIVSLLVFGTCNGKDCNGGRSKPSYAFQAAEYLRLRSVSLILTFEGVDAASTKAFSLPELARALPGTCSLIVSISTDLSTLQLAAEQRICCGHELEAADGLRIFFDAGYQLHVFRVVMLGEVTACGSIDVNATAFERFGVQALRSEFGVEVGFLDRQEFSIGDRAAVLLGES